jgi:hypothetical protein
MPCHLRLCLLVLCLLSIMPNALTPSHQRPLPLFRVLLERLPPGFGLLRLHAFLLRLSGHNWQRRSASEPSPSSTPTLPNSAPCLRLRCSGCTFRFRSRPRLSVASANPSPQSSRAFIQCRDRSADLLDAKYCNFLSEFSRKDAK